MTNHGLFQFIIPTNYTCREGAYHIKDIPSPISLTSPSPPPPTFPERYITFKPLDKAEVKCIFEKIYSVAVMERRNSREEKQVQLKAISLPLIRRNGGLEKTFCP